MGKLKNIIHHSSFIIHHSSFSLSPLLLNSFVLHFFKPLNFYNALCIILRGTSGMTSLDP
ncbi:hypothetical protein AUK22_10850 [bacterium CG2_30_54_10]|nr:MAG: hypothetical protein AUK22_10850 [bacterium CG2_30_54_10]